MSSEPGQQPSEADTAPHSAPKEPTEEELRAAYEAELSRITPADMMLQAAVSLLNIGARRLGLTAATVGSETGDGSPPGQPAAGSAGAERDLAQVRDAIEGVKALLKILERSIPQDLRPLREALSQLQMAYAREAQADGEGDSKGGQGPPPAGKDAPTTGDQDGAPGPAQSSGRLWVPGS
jgi:hypothetical protein